MKATGIVRKIDNLGRIVVPKELRKTMGIDVKDPIEIYVDEVGNIVLKKFKPSCVFVVTKKRLLNMKIKIYVKSV